MSTPADVAHWMLDELNACRAKEILQEDVVYEIKEKFGKQFVYYNHNGNLAIDAKVLKAFAQLTADTVVWERGLRLWRLR